MLAAKLCGVFALLQVVLGVATLIHMVPIELASLHQAGGLLVFTVLTWFNFEGHEGR